MIKETDFWGSDDFEDTVATALIACYETKFKKNRGAPPSDRLNEDRIALIRSKGPYIASSSRVLMREVTDNANWCFDLTNDPLPISGLCGYPTAGSDFEKNGSYLNINYVRQVSELGKYWHKVKSGVLYEILAMEAHNDGVHGERRFFTVTKTGEVVACNQNIATIRGYIPGEKVPTASHDAEFLRATSACASVVLQTLADKRFCWSISAYEKGARAHLGCMKEEVKSLLYARSLPMTATGRKRPILHLVESHKRRLRNGTDIDVTQFLRGQQTVEIGGTVFKVNPPDTLRFDVSMPSRKHYFADITA